MMRLDQWHGCSTVIRSNDPVLCVHPCACSSQCHTLDTLLWQGQFGAGEGRRGEEMVKTRTENVVREEEYGKEEEKGKRAGNTEGIKKLKVAAENLQWWEKFLKNNHNQRAADKVVLLVYKHMLTHVIIDRKLVLGGGGTQKKGRLRHLWLSWSQEVSEHLLLCMQWSCCGNPEAVEVPTAALLGHVSEQPSPEQQGRWAAGSRAFPVCWQAHGSSRAPVGAVQSWE